VIDGERILLKANVPFFNDKTNTNEITLAAVHYVQKHKQMFITVIVNNQQQFTVDIK